MKTPQFIILVFSLFWTSVSALVESLSSVGMSPQIPLILFICCISLWTHDFVDRYRIVPMKLIFLLYTILSVVLCQTFWNLFGRSDKVMFINPYMLNVIFYPVMVSNALFSSDKYLFLSTLPSVAFSSTIIYGGIIALHSVVLKFMLFMDWPWLKCIILAVIFSPTHSQYITFLLNDHKFKKLREKMKGESVISIGFILIYFEITVGLFLDYEFQGYGHLAGLFFYKVLIGLFCGYLMGIFATFMIRLSPDDTELCIVTLICTFVVSYFFVEYINASPFFNTLSMGLVLMTYRDYLMEDNVVKIKEVLNFLYYISDFGVFVFTTFAILSYRVLNTAIEIRPAIFTYFTVNFSRGFTFVIAYPIFKCISPEFTITQLLMTAWAKVIDNSTLIMTVTLLYKEDTHEFAKDILNLVLVSTLISHSLNTISFAYLIKNRWLKRRTLNQIANMMNMLKYLSYQRDRYVSMWKMKCLMADVRWDVVSILTNVKQPFKRDDKHTIDDHLLQIAPRTATCHDCKRVITAQLSTKDRTDMKMEATRRILNEMNILVARFHNMGLISAECSLVAKRMITESNNICININELSNYFKPNSFLEAAKRIYGRMFKFDKRSLQIPRMPFRKFCYKIILNKYCCAVIFALNLASIYPIIVFIVENSNTSIYYTATIINVLFTLMFLLQMVITINAYSFIYYRDGLKAYFSSYWHMLDFLIAIMAICDVVVSFIINLKNLTEWESTLYNARPIRLVIVLKVLQGQTLNILNLLEDFDDVRIAFGFEMVKTFRACYDEVLMMLNRIIDSNYELEIECRESLEKARWAVLDLMMQIQLEKPLVAISVKTKHVMNAYIKCMYVTITELQLTGFLDDYEYEKLRKRINSMEMRRKTLGNKLNIDHDELINGVLWVNRDKEILEFIRESAMIVDFRAGTVICGEDEYMHGIYVVIQGIMKTVYTPRVSTIDELLNNGHLPVMDFIKSYMFDRDDYELILPGNSVGELSFLTTRSYDAKITAVSPVKAMFLRNSVIMDAIELNSDMIDGVGPRMWKSTVYDMCKWILKSTDVFENYSKNEITKKMQRSFVPNLAGFRTFHRNEGIEDLILLDGQIVNLHIKEVLNAPCYIPRNITKFSIVANETTFLNSVILIIPMPETNIASLMITLMEQSDVATEDDPDFKSRCSKLSPYQDLEGKANMSYYTTSSIFTPLEILKLSRN